MKSRASNVTALKERRVMIKYNENKIHSSRESPLSRGIESDPIILPSEAIDKSGSPDTFNNQDSNASTSLIVQLQHYKNIIDCILLEQTSSHDDFRNVLVVGVKRKTKLRLKQSKKKKVRKTT